MSTSGTLRKDAMTICGRLVFGVRRVAAADLLADSGLLKMEPHHGALVMIEGGAVLRGIQLLDYSDPDTAAEVDITTDDQDSTTMFVLVTDGSPGALITVLDEDLTVDPEHRIRVINTAGDGYADGAVTLNPVFISYNADPVTPANGRWRAPWSTP